jgi:hypothetical protein
MQELLLRIAKDLRLDIEIMDRFFDRHCGLSSASQGIKDVKARFEEKRDIHELVVDRMTNLTKTQYQAYLDKEDGITDADQKAQTDQVSSHVG